MPSLPAYVTFLRTKISDNPLLRIHVKAVYMYLLYIWEFSKLRRNISAKISQKFIRQKSNLLAKSLIFLQNMKKKINSRKDMKN